MDYKEQLIHDVNIMYAEHGIANKAYWDKCIINLLDKSPNDDLIKQISAKWYKRSQSIELFWDFIDSNLCYNMSASYRISELHDTWCVKYSGKEFNEIKTGDKDFIDHVKDCLSVIRETQNRRKCKPETIDDFCQDLISRIEWHISAMANCADYDAQGMALGVNPTNCEFKIDKRENLQSFDIYDLDSYTGCWVISGGWYELRNKGPLVELAHRYITEEIITETRESQLKNIRKIDDKQFRQYFYNIIYKYLDERNRIMDDKIPVYLRFEYGKEKYLGIEPHSLKPFIGVEDALDGCDVYDLKGIEDAFEKDDNVFFVTCKGNDRKFILKDKSIINLFVAKYFSEKKVDETKLPLIKKAEEHIITDDTLFTRVYLREYNSFGFYSTIIGKYADTSHCEKYCFRPKTLCDLVNYLERSYKEFEEGSHKVVGYLNKARLHKKNKNYKLAITALEKAVTILHTIEQDGYPEVHSCLIDCYAKIKDRENQIRIIKMAIDLYNNPKYTMMLKKLEGTQEGVILTRPSYQVTTTCNYGEHYDRHVRKRLPEYSFGKNPINPYVLEHADMLPKIREIDKHFQDLLKKGENAEAREDYETAVEIYEQLIAERIYTPHAHERLIVLYSKADRKHDLQRILQSGIKFFEERKQSQCEYVRELAKKYGAEEYCEQCIKAGEKIRYPGGYIILFQDYPFVDKWKKRLEKLTNK